MISSSSLGFQKCFAVTRGFTLPDAVQKCNERLSQLLLHYRPQREINYSCFCFCEKSMCWLSVLSCPVTIFGPCFIELIWPKKHYFLLWVNQNHLFMAWGCHKGHSLFVFLSFFLCSTFSLSLSLSLIPPPYPLLSLKTKHDCRHHTHPTGGPSVVYFQLNAQLVIITKW